METEKTSMKPEQRKLEDYDKFIGQGSAALFLETLSQHCAHYAVDYCNIQLWVSDNKFCLIGTPKEYYREKLRELMRKHNLDWSFDGRLVEAAFGSCEVRQEFPADAYVTIFNWLKGLGRES
jgi:hypothetical protein